MFSYNHKSIGIKTYNVWSHHNQMLLFYRPHVEFNNKHIQDSHEHIWNNVEQKTR